MDENLEDTELHHPTRRKLLSVLAGSGVDPGVGLKKTDLAERVYGEANSSTRSMTTRATAALLAAGFLEERLEGRERWVRLSPRGRAIVDHWHNASVNRAGWRTPEAAIQAAQASGPDGHPRDRQRFHLRHAALVALGSLRARGLRPDDDGHYQQVLLALIDARSDPAADLEFFRRHLAPTWPRHDVSRLLLAECILRFQSAEKDKRERRSTFSDLILIGDAFGDDLTRDPYLQPADVLIWATCATAVAHHHLLEPDSEFRRISARGVVQRVARLLEVFARHADPSHAVALAYRRALARKVAYGAGEWNEPPAAPSSQAPPSASGDVQGAICNHVKDADGVVQSSLEGNEELDRYELTLTQGLGRMLVRVLPDAEPFFRRVHHRDATLEMSQWAHHRAAVLAEIAPRAIAKATQIKNQIEQFEAQQRQLVEQNPALADVVAPYLRQCAFLLGKPRAATAPRLRAEEHAALILNNLWTPEMVIADVAANA